MTYNKNNFRLKPDPDEDVFDNQEQQDNYDSYMEGWDTPL